MPIEASRLEDVGVANRPLSPRDCRRRSGRSKTAKRKPGTSKNDKKCANLYISGDETRFQHKLKKVVFDAPCYQDSEKNNGNRLENFNTKCSDLYISGDQKKKKRG